MTDEIPRLSYERLDVYQGAIEFVSTVAPFSKPCLGETPPWPIS